MTEYKNSVVSGAELEPLFSLGEIYVSDFLKDGEEPKGPPCELALAFDPISKAVQLTKQPDSNLMWGSMYFYRSHTNRSMRLALKDLAEKTCNCTNDNGGIYLDVASNDGTLLSYVDESKYYRVGIDPSDYTEDMEHRSELNIQDYFSAAACSARGIQKAKKISCAACFYDISTPVEFLKDVYQILEDDGVFVMQISYSPLMLLQLEFGNIVHEHIMYYNLTSLKYLFDRIGFIIRDVELNDVNGGSIRIYLQKDVSPRNFRTIANRDVAEVRINSILEWEENNGYNGKKVYLNFYERILELRKKTVYFIKFLKSEKKSVWGYGASTKGNTLLQFFGLDNNLIDGIAEKQDFKFGRRTVGTNISIYSEEVMRKMNPNALLILPWFFREVFLEREKEYMDNGGMMIFPAPKFEVYPKI